MTFQQRIYSNRSLSLLTNILRSYTDNVFKDSIVKMKVPRTWFFFSVPFVASVVSNIIFFISDITLRVNGNMVFNLSYKSYLQVTRWSNHGSFIDERCGKGLQSVTENEFS